MLLKSDNIEIFVNHKADEVIEELFHSPFSRHQIGLVTSMKGRDFVFVFIYCIKNVSKINQGRGGSNIDSPD